MRAHDLSETCIWQPSPGFGRVIPVPVENVLTCDEMIPSQSFTHLMWHFGGISVDS